MKFGQRLEQESVLEWGIHNVDYNSLKYEIKTHTSRDQARAMVIPGQKDMALERFESTFFDELVAQHDRVNLFVASKASELSYRLDYLADSIDRLASKCARTTAPMSLKRQRRLIKYQQDILQCGDDAQALTRFVAAQTEAFRKILKKYKKWTGSAALGQRFREHVLSDPKSFTRRDFSHLRSRYDETRAVLRTSLPQITRIVQTPATPQMLYWNEYDHGSDNEGTEDTYTLYVDPERGADVPGLSYVQAALSAPFTKAKSWAMGKKQPTEGAAAVVESPERQSLLLPPVTAPVVPAGYNTMTSSQGTTSVSDGDDDLTSREDNNYPTEGYLVHHATFPSINEQSLRRYRENVMFWGTTGSFATSFIIMAIAGTLLFTGRHRNRLEVDAGAALGVIASMFAASFGTTRSQALLGPVVDLIVYQQTQQH
ncbi:unnamed protein product [Parascedosporium putredinis]|uniref:SPX domain-containing protein n=1 Tax=Parascedosporium putredinis TaxID=1442378 RepID=A0A9P1GYG8_9PEZI|nr:unnamed protein product [Parascedosporium putredinis]CAI7989990.1 unnamed protein product [Parascedosporium putredinis]